MQHMVLLVQIQSYVTTFSKPTKPTKKTKTKTTKQ